MKNLVLLTLGLFILTSNLQAEIICLKNSKKASVVNGKVNIKIPKLITIESSSCPIGYSSLTDLNKAPVTQTGVWNLSGGSTENYAAAQISFPVKLQTAPTAVIFVIPEVADTTCTGSFSNPTAPEGVLCIYQAVANNLDDQLVDRYFLYNAIDNGGSIISTSSIYGGALYGYNETNGVNFYAWGTWAMTQTPTDVF